MIQKTFRILSILIPLLCLGVINPMHSQTLDSLAIVSDPKEYEIGNIKVTGATYSDENAIIAISGFSVGKKVYLPGSETGKAIRALSKLRLFTSVDIYLEKIIGDVAFIEIRVVERPSVSGFDFNGAKKIDIDKLTELVETFIRRGSIVTDNTKALSIEEVKNYYKDKGFLDVVTTVSEVSDTIRTNSVKLIYDIDPGKKVKIKDITFNGAANAKPKKLRKQMSSTKEKRKFLASSKFLREEYQEDKRAVINYYNTLGYRDAILERDSMWRDENGMLNIHLFVDEGNRYYFREITWKGNSVYSDQQLTQVLGIEKGDPYDSELIESRLRFSQDNRDISSLYLDNGYLFFQINPIETAIENDSIDIEMQIYEGAQATIDKVIIEGNDRTHEHVIRRELRTLPGQKFSRSDIIRSQRQILNLGYFNQETLDIQTPVNQQAGTVDIKYVVEEKPSDQLELSAGWGGIGNGVIGTLGVTFNNFSVRNIFNKKAWNPLPQGDGQRVSLRAQTNGRFYQSYNASFSEPWLGGKKPTSFTLSGYYTKLDNSFSSALAEQSLAISNVSVGIGTRLKWPDDNFIFSAAANIQSYNLNNYRSALFVIDDGSILTDGQYNNFSLTLNLTRSTINEPTFPQSGSRFSLNAQLTPPYSSLNDKNYNNLEPQDKFEWLEYHKWKFDAEWYSNVFDKFVIKAQIKVGLIGFYNRDIGTTPFDRFQLGGDGLSNRQTGFQGFEIISLRGYDVEDIEASESGGAAAYDKFTVELRYPFSTNPQSTIFAMLFVQGGNAWTSLRDFNPFDIRRSAGVGVRIFLPMFGTLGFDYGFGFDKPDLQLTNAKWTDYARFSVVLGFEPE
ncbi:MAG: outer membrane protein assembly factor BamA [Bacteroidia bacterium]|nr:outer membrane protein assembly factor BamA [Bacteroidia bacterium]